MTLSQQFLYRYKKYSGKNESDLCEEEADRVRLTEEPGRAVSYGRKHCEGKGSEACSLRDGHFGRRAEKTVFLWKY